MKSTVKLGYLMLVVSIVFEQIGTGFLTGCAGFTKLVPTLCLIGAYVVSYWFFAKVLTMIQLSVSYATWVAAGTVSATLIGMFFFGQEMSPMGWLAIAILSAGIFILNIFGTPKEEQKDKENGGMEQ